MMEHDRYCCTIFVFFVLFFRGGVYFVCVLWGCSELDNFCRRCCFEERERERGRWHDMSEAYINIYSLCYTYTMRPKRKTGEISQIFFSFFFMYSPEVSSFSVCCAELGSEQQELLGCRRRYYSLLKSRRGF